MKQILWLGIFCAILQIGCNKVEHQNDDPAKIYLNTTDCFSVLCHIKSSSIDTAKNNVVIFQLDGDKAAKYWLEYRKNSKQFVAVEILKGLKKEILSEPLEFVNDVDIPICFERDKQGMSLFVKTHRGIVVNFDDGYKNTYTNAYTYMKPLGIKGTIHIITDYVDKNDVYIHLDQLKEMKADGWTVDNHTVHHVHLIDLDENGQREEIMKGQEYLKQNGFDYDLIATPFGQFNNITLKLFKELGIVAHRGFSSLGYGSNQFPFVDLYRLKSDPIASAETAQTGINRIDDRMKKNMLMFLTFHSVDQDHYDFEKFKLLMNHIIEKGYPTYTYSEIVRLTDIGNVVEFKDKNDHTGIPYSKERFSLTFNKADFDYSYSPTKIDKQRLKNMWEKR